MIAKLIKGKSFRGAVEYDLQPGKSILLETNMAGASPRALAVEFEAVRTLRPRLGKAVCHTSLSIHPDERLTDDQWREAAHVGSVLRHGGVGVPGYRFGGNQYFGAVWRRGKDYRGPLFDGHPVQKETAYASGATVFSECLSEY